MARILAIFLSVCFMLVSASGAFANDTDRLGLRLRNKTSGDMLPAIILTPKEKVKSFQGTLKRSDDTVVKVSAANLAADTEKVLTVKQDYGSYSYAATFKVKYDNGDESDFTMNFTLERVKKLELELDPEDVDLDARTMSFSINNPADRAELIFFDSDGKETKKVTKKYDGAEADTKLELTWKDPGEFVYMDLKVYDTAGFWKGVRLTPFSISIPHDNVVFDSGKWEIKKKEEPKLKKALEHIKAELKKLEEANAQLPLTLFIAGYTDTVGSKQSNRTLSNNRARSIGAWFKKNKLGLPVKYQGFGEDVLAVDTPDDTDEERNRRAIYILATQMPAKSCDIPKSSWQSL